MLDNRGSLALAGAGLRPTPEYRQGENTTHQFREKQRAFAPNRPDNSASHTVTHK